MRKTSVHQPAQVRDPAAWRTIDNELPSKEAADLIVKMRKHGNSVVGPSPLFESLEMRTVESDVPGLWAIESRPQVRPQTRFNPKDNPAFGRWFGNSKVENQDGTPKVVFHGTNADIATFKPGLDGGIHFGSAAQAGMRVAGAGKNLVPVYLAIDNPRRSKDLGGKWKGKIASAKSAGHDGIVYLNRYEGIAFATIERAQNEGVNLDRLSDERFRQFAPEAQDSFIAFRPEQVKSAIGNSGAFDKTDPDINDRRAAASKAQDFLENLEKKKAVPHA